MLNLRVNLHKNLSLKDCLSLHHFEVEQLDENTMHVVRGSELPVCLHERDDRLYFEADIGSVTEISDQGLYYKLLDLNTDIQPVSVGINSTDSSDPRLVLVENIETETLAEHDLISIFELFERATHKVEEVLSDYISH